MAEPSRAEIICHLFRALSARTSDSQAVYEGALGDAVEAIFRDISSTPDALTAEASRRLYETLDSLIAGLDFLAAAIELNVGVGRVRTLDLLETILQEQTAQAISNDDRRSNPRSWS